MTPRRTSSRINGCSTLLGSACDELVVPLLGAESLCTARGLTCRSRYKGLERVACLLSKRLYSDGKIAYKDNNPGRPRVAACT